MSRSAFRLVRSLGLAGVAALTLLSAGCVAVPGSTAPVVVGDAPQGGQENFDDQLDLQPQGPQPGASADAIVRAFLSASVTTEPSHPVARQFLTGPAAKLWRDSKSVTVIEPSIGIQVNGAGDVTLRATRVGVVDDTGIYTPSTSALEIEFKLMKVKGQWRIMNPPDGIIINRSSFDDVYQVASVYFLDPTETRVVPDLRYFLTQPNQRVNLLVQALLSGPSPSLAGGVRNELSGGVDKAAQVSIVDGQARVQLTGLSQKNDTQLKALSAQVVWTLRGLPINSVRIYNDDVAVSAPGVAVDQLLSDWDTFNPDFVPTTTTGYFLRAGTVHDAADGVVAGTQDVGATAAGISLDGKSISVVTGTAVSAGPIGKPPTPIPLDGVTSLSAPTWGASADDFWVVRNGVDVVRVPLKGVAAVVPAPGLSTLGTVTSMRRSRDGVRVAFLVDKDGRGTVYLSTILTGANGSISLSAPQELAQDLDVVSMDWVDARSIVVLSDPGSDSTPSPLVLLIDGSDRAARAAPVFTSGAKAVAAAPDRPLLCAGDGVVLRLEESSWVPLVAGTSVLGGSPFYPG